MPVLGKGTFGCVVDPPLKCETEKINKKGKVSKIMIREDAIEELNEYKVLEKIPELKKYLLDFPIYCTPENNTSFHKEIKACDHRRINRVYKEKSVQGIRLLTLENGGVGLDTFTKKIFKELDNPNFKKFLTSITNLFESVDVLMKNNLVHQDIKLNNIVYSPINGKISLIDFGKLISFRRMIDLSKQDNNLESQPWHNYPPEAEYMNKSQFIFKVVSNEDSKIYDAFLKNMAFSWDTYSLSLCLSNMFDYFLKTPSNDVKINLDSYKTFFHEVISLLRPFIILSNNHKELIKNKLLGRNYNITELKTKYTDLLKKHNMYVTKKPNPTQKVIDLSLDSSVQIIVDKNEKSDKKCKEGKEPHPTTRRCVKKCKKGEKRNIKGKCVSITVKSLNKQKKEIDKKCKEGKEPHPISGRCVNKCKTNEERDNKGKCVNKTKKTLSKKRLSNKTSKSKNNFVKIDAYIDKNQYTIGKK